MYYTRAHTLLKNTGMWKNDSFSLFIKVQFLKGVMLSTKFENHQKSSKLNRNFPNFLWIFENFRSIFFTVFRQFFFTAQNKHNIDEESFPIFDDTFVVNEIHHVLSVFTQAPGKYRILEE